MRLLLAFLAFLAPAVAAQTAVPAGDINTESVPLGSFFNPQGLMVGDVLYYRGYTLAHGNELWRTDGTAAGTYMVADINPGTSGSSPAGFTELAGQVVFWASSPGIGRELWITDGTAAGTQLVRDLSPGPDSSTYFDELLAMGGHVYFPADNGLTGVELWRTDGTSGGTQLVADVLPGPGPSFPRFLTLAPSGAHVVFAADDGATGFEPYITDGSAAGTKQLLDVNPGVSGSNPQAFAALGTKVLFNATHPVSGSELWSTNGTTAGTLPLKDINPGSGSSTPNVGEGALLNGELYFSADVLGIGRELWKSDGTPAGTVLVADLFVGLPSSTPRWLTPFGGDLYFRASALSKQTLWRVDGSTGAIEDMLPTQNPTYPQDMTASGGLLFFRGQHTTHGVELFVTDGTAPGATLVKEIAPGTAHAFPAHLHASASGGILFGVQDPSAGLEPWISDGTEAGTQLVLDAEPTVRTLDADPEELTAIGGKELYFSADDGLIGRELYRWTKAGGVELVKDIATGTDFSGNPEDSDPSDFVQAIVNGAPITFFIAENDAKGRELWKTNGTAGGTKLVKDIGPNGIGGQVAHLTPALGRLFFSAGSGTSDREVWTSDGTAAGTQQLVDLVPGIGSSSPSEFTQLGDQVVFRASDAGGDIELYITDGTAAGTQLLADIGAGFSSAPEWLTRVGDRIAFVVDRASQSTAKDLWVTDGTTAGTQFVSEIGSAGYAGVKGELVAWRDKLLFHGRDNDVQGLFVSDLTAAGTHPLYAPHSAWPATEITPAGEWVFFLMGGDVHAYDANTGTTALLTDELFEQKSAAGLDAQLLNDGFVFALEPTGFTGPDEEIYFTDGTLQNTGIVFDVTPETSTTGAAIDSLPEQLVWVDGDLLFVAEQPSGVGREVFRAIGAGGYVADLGLSGSGHFITSGPALIGEPVTVTGTGAPAGTSFLGFGPNLAQPNGNLVVPGDAAWLNPGASVVATITSTPSWSFTLNVPPVLALVGAQFNLQSWTFNGAFPAQTSNGLQFVIGQ